MTYPRSHNGYVDSGKPLAQSIGKRCPNCGSASYRETVSLEECSSCGLRFDYWGGRGGNDVYRAWDERERAAERIREIERDLQWAKENPW